MLDCLVGGQESSKLSPNLILLWDRLELHAGKTNALYILRGIEIGTYHFVLVYLTEILLMTRKWHSKLHIYALIRDRSCHDKICGLGNPVDRLGRWQIVMHRDCFWIHGLIGQGFIRLNCRIALVRQSSPHLIAHFKMIINKY